MALALFLLLAASQTFEESFREGLLALQRNAAVKAAGFGASDSLVQSTLVIYYTESERLPKAAEAQAR